MKGEFHYSVNLLSQEMSEILNRERTLEEIRDNRRLYHQVLTQIPIDERQNWVIVNRAGLLNNSLHEVYIAFKLFWLLTLKGRLRPPTKALKMVGVPFIKIKWAINRIEIADDGVEVIDLVRLK